MKPILLIFACYSVHLAAQYIDLDAPTFWDHASRILHLLVAFFCAKGALS